MPKLSEIAVPSYRHHKKSGQAVVTLGGKDHYLGRHKSAESRAEYSRVVGEWMAAGRQLPADPNAVTVGEVAAAFRNHAKRYYADAHGNASKAVVNFNEALRPLLKLYGKTAAVDFGPLRLKACRESMIDAGRCRTNINRNVTRIRGVFKWAVENEMLPASVHHGLMAVSGLRYGRSEAKESSPVKPVPVAHVESTLLHVSRQVAAMMRLQLLTGMRPGEVVLLRGCDMDTTGELWIYRPARHKTQLHGHTREVYFGPKAQELIGPFLKTDLQAYLFSPVDAERERREALHAARTTPMSCGNRPGTNKRHKPRREPGERYTTMTYFRAVQYGCDKAFPAPADVADKPDELKTWQRAHRWHPHQLRHNAATELRKRYGLEAAQVTLGHKTLSVTEIYAEKNVAAAMRIAAEVG